MKHTINSYLLFEMCHSFRPLSILSRMKMQYNFCVYVIYTHKKNNMRPTSGLHPTSKYTYKAPRYSWPTDGHSDKGNDNTRRLKLAQDKLLLSKHERSICIGLINKSIICLQLVLIGESVSNAVNLS